MSWTPSLLNEYKCPICQKIFYAESIWAYKLTVNGHERYYCKWTCLLKAKAEQAEKRKQARRVKK